MVDVPSTRRPLSFNFHTLFIAALVLFCANSAFCAHPTIRVNVPNQPPSNATHAIEENFLGISFELSPFDTLWGTSSKRLPAAMQNYLHNLIARMPTKPLRIRIGGNGMDGSTYVRKLKPILQVQDPSAYFNDIPVNFGAGFFELLNGMTDKVGAMQFTIGLSMRNIKGDFDESLKNVLDLAKDAKKMLGGRLDALLLGNEPDLYTTNGKRPSYGINTYIPEVDQTVAALTNADVLELAGTPLLGGPTVCCSWGLLDVLNAGLEKHPFKYYTLQRYPNHACEGVNERNTNLTYYLRHENVEPYLSWNAPGMARAKALGVPVVFSEYNSVACGGTNISTTFAMALWSIDVGLKAASLGFSAAFLHTREFGIQYNLFDPPAANSSRSMESGWRTGTPYYATLFLAEVTSPEGNIVVDLNLHDPSQTPNANASATVAGYAIYSAKDRGRQKLVFINYSDSDSQPFRIAANTTYKVEYRTLTAPSVRETKNVTWGGQTVGGYGNLVGEQVEPTMEWCRDSCIVNVPGPGAVLVTLGNSATLFKGNTTIAVPGESGTRTNRPCWPLGLVLLVTAGTTMLFS